VESVGRKTLLPGDLVRKYENDAFWRDPARNPNQVKVV
jgi:sulfotransferase